MITYLDKILYLYPTIQRVMLWETRYDGTPFEDPYDGIVWENTEIDKPSKEILDAIPEALVIAAKKEKQLDALCESLKSDFTTKMMYKEALKTNVDLSFKDFVKSIQDMEIV